MRLRVYSVLVLLAWVVLSISTNTSSSTAQLNNAAITTTQPANVVALAADRVRAFLSGIIDHILSFLRLLHFRRTQSRTSGDASDRAFGRNNRSALMWNGERASAHELDSLSHIRSTKEAAIAAGTLASTPWLSALTDKDILRFLRHHGGKRDETWKALQSHAAWRTSPMGSESIVKANRFQHSILNREIFWLGMSKIGCPTLVIRTQAHDGADYQEDPKVFTAFFVWILEQGRLKVS